MSETNETKELYDRISYSENRTINIGNFEKIECFFHFGHNFKYIDMVNKAVDITYSEEAIVKGNENFKETAKDVVKKVRSVLDAREAQIRKRTAEFVDFHTLKKIPTKE